MQVQVRARILEDLATEAHQDTSCNPLEESLNSYRSAEIVTKIFSLCVFLSLPVLMVEPSYCRHMISDVDVILMRF